MRNSAIELRGTDFIKYIYRHRKVTKYTGTAIELQETEHTWMYGILMS
jgi:hypothetical protein